MGLLGDIWDDVSGAVETVVNTVTTVGGAIVDTVEGILAPFTLILALTLGALTVIPILGPIIKWVLNILTTIIWYFIGIGDFILSMIGIRPEKKLRACVIVLSDSKGQMASDQDILVAMTIFSQTFKDKANVRVIKSSVFQYTSAFSSVKEPTKDWISHPDASSDDILVGECYGDGVKANFWTDGSRMEALSLLTSPFNYLRRLLGYGAPIFVFIVRNFSDPNTNGCSNGPLADYILIAGKAIRPGTAGLVKDRYVIAHESGHACNLTHKSLGYSYPITNLMYPDDTRTNNELTSWQVSVLRGSRHATYF